MITNEQVYLYDDLFKLSCILSVWFLCSICLSERKASQGDGRYILLICVIVLIYTIAMTEVFSSYLDIIVNPSSDLIELFEYEI